jgi:hypothetical protein
MTPQKIRRRRGARAAYAASVIAQAKTGSAEAER